MYSSKFIRVISSILLVVLPLLVKAYPIAELDTSLPRRAAVGSSPTSQLSAILSNANTCPTSSGECVAPADAVGPIISGLYKYGIDTAPEQAAVVSLMAFESVDFKYNHNVSPGRPGQGTRAMLMPNFVLEYVKSIDTLASGLTAAGADLVKILALVQDNEHSFAAASWFYSTKCSDTVKNQVKYGGEAGWTNYLKSCVGVDPTAYRKAYWSRAREQFSVTN